MKEVIKINSAEGMFLLSFNQLINNIEEYTGENCTISQGWDSVFIKSNNLEFSAIWRGEVFSADYDRIIFFMNIPQNIIVNISAVINGERCTIVKNKRGDKYPCEPTGEIPEEATLSEIKFDFLCDENSCDANTVLLYWGGFLSSKREYLIEEEIPKYDKSSWDGYINYSAKPTAEFNVFFTESELEHFKAKMNEEEHKEFFHRLYSDAESHYPQYDPENDIRLYIPVHESLYRYTRVRDRSRKEIHNAIPMLAAAGYFFDKPQWTNMAARLIMCLIKTPYWFEGDQGRVEGSTWHHVCFTEQEVISQITVSLGFMGGVFSSDALAEILEVLKKNYKTVLKCCREKGYRRFSNQGLVEQAGRMQGACSFYLLGDNSFVEEIEDCYKEHTDMINDYINEEHHCVEGIGYYSYSIINAIKLWMIYAKFKNVDIKNVVPEAVVNSIDYVNAMMSTTTNVGKPLFINDSNVPEISDMILNFFVAYFDWNDGKWYQSNKTKSLIERGDEFVSGLALMTIPEGIKTPYVKPDLPRYYIFEKSGLGSYEHENGKFWFYAERNPLTGHYHNDRGAIAIEAFGKTVLVDIGVMGYSNAKSMNSKREEYHNLAHPDGIPMRVQSRIASISAAEAGVGCVTVVTKKDFEGHEAKIDYIRKIENGIEFSADTSELFDFGVLKANRKGKYISSDFDAEIRICDTWEFQNATSLYVNFMSYAKWTIDKNTAISELDGVRISLSFESESEFELTTDDSMLDANSIQVYRLRVKTVPSLENKVITKGRIEKNEI